MASLAHTHSAGNLNGSGSLSRGLLEQAARLFRTWWERHQARQQLLEMDDHMLHDIGLTRGAVVREWQKGFWQA